jgi:hypothetical protein
MGTGPKTKKGKIRSAKNASRHGQLEQPHTCSPAEAIARKIAGPAANGEVRELARRVARPQVHLDRVHARRLVLISKLFSSQLFSKRQYPPNTGIKDLMRYLTRAESADPHAVRRSGNSTRVSHPAASGRGSLPKFWSIRSLRGSTATNGERYQGVYKSAIRDFDSAGRSAGPCQITLFWQNEPNQTRSARQSLVKINTQWRFYSQVGHNSRRTR